MLKRVTIPEAQFVVGEKDGKPTMIELGLTRFLEEQVWPLPYWRTGSSDLLHTVLRLANLFRDKVVGDEVDLTQADHVHVVKAAMMMEKVISGPNMIQILTLLCALTDAKDIGE